MELDPKFLDALDVTCIVTCVGGVRADWSVDTHALTQCRQPEATIVHVSFCPNYTPGLNKFKAVLKEIMGHRSVLIHCKMGQKRSVIVAAAVAMVTKHFGTLQQLRKFLWQNDRDLNEQELDLAIHLAQLCGQPFRV